MTGGVQRAIELPISEFDDQDEESIQQGIYRELLWICIEKRRKPGWTAVAFKQMFGKWPPWYMRELEPQEPRAAVLRYVTRSDNRYRRQMKKQEEEGRREREARKSETGD